MSLPSSTSRRQVYVACGVLAASILTGCAKNAPQTTLKPQGPISRTIDHLINPVYIVAAVVFVLVQGLVLVAMFKFRDRPGSPEPKQVHGNTRLEVGWTLIPAVILFAIAIPTIKTIFDLASAPKNAVKVTVTGHQFWWEYNYTDLGVVTANELRIPAGRPVELTLKGDDVIHSFWVPALTGKTDVIPGRQNHMHLEADHPGTYEGQCTEFCGLSHANMRLKAIAQTPADFDAWVASQKAPVAEPAEGSPAAAGLVTFNGRGCGGCHTVEGRSQGKVGPDLTHFSTRGSFAGSVLDRTPANIRKWLHDPPGVKPGSKMPNLHLSSQEITDLIAYLDTLK